MKLSTNAALSRTQYYVTSVAVGFFCAPNSLTTFIAVLIGALRTRTLVETHQSMWSVLEHIMQNKSRLNKWAKNANDPNWLRKNKLDHFSSVETSSTQKLKHSQT